MYQGNRAQVSASATPAATISQSLLLLFTPAAFAFGRGFRNIQRRFFGVGMSPCIPGRVSSAFSTGVLSGRTRSASLTVIAGLLRSEAASEIRERVRGRPLAR